MKKIILILISIGNFAFASEADLILNQVRNSDRCQNARVNYHKSPTYYKGIVKTCDQANASNSGVIGGSSVNIGGIGNIRSINSIGDIGGSILNLGNLGEQKSYIPPSSSHLPINTINNNFDDDFFDEDEGDFIEVGVNP
jgi:hypothetical protein